MNNLPPIQIDETDTRLASVLAKLERALKLIQELDDWHSGWSARKAWFVDIERDPKRRLHRIYLARHEGVPPLMRTTVGDFAANVRTILDQTLYAVAKSLGVESTNLIFPIGRKDRGEFQKLLRGRLKGMPSQLIEYVDSLKPYPGGDELLHNLAELNNSDKHREIIGVGLAVEAKVSAEKGRYGLIQFNGLHGTRVKVNHTALGKPLKQGDTLIGPD